MRWAFWRRVEGLTLDDIDQEIDEHQRHAEKLISELQITVEEQGKLWHSLREAKGGEPGAAPG